MPKIYYFDPIEFLNFAPIARLLEDARDGAASVSVNLYFQ